jgi:hypothetical protein
MKPDVNGVYRLGNPIGFNLANQIKVLQLLKLMQLQKSQYSSYGYNLWGT